MAEIIEFPFDSGAYEAADREWLPPNLLERVENMRLDLDGRLGIRPGFTALASTTYSVAPLVTYDLANFAGRLIALGDQCALGRPTDLFEYVNTGAGAWRGTACDDTTFGTGVRLPRMTKFRDTGRIADPAADPFWVDVAAGGSRVCEVVYCANERTIIHVYNPATDQTLLLTSRSLSKARVVFAGSNFWIVGLDPGNQDLVGYRFNPTTETLLTGPTTLRALAGATADIAVAQTGASDFSVAYINATDVFAARYNSAGVLQAGPWTVSTNDAVAVAICGNAAGTRITVAWQQNTAFPYPAFLRTFDQTGAGVVGPTALFGGATGNIPRLGMVQAGTNICIIGNTFDTNTFRTCDQRCTNESTHALATTTFYEDSVPVARPVSAPNGSNSAFFYGAQDYRAALAKLGTNQLVEDANGQVACQVDPTLASQLNATINQINGTCSIGTKLYWARTFRGILANSGTPDQGTSSAVAEIESVDTGRRQMTQLANELYVAGALPTVYDGRLLVEHGFHERPAVSLSQAAGGGKTLLGRYNVRLTWCVVDSRGAVLRSQGGDAAEITLTGANQTINVIASAPHSLRTYPRGSTLDPGTSVQLEVYCTTAGGGNFFLDKRVFLDPLLVFWGAPVAVALTQNDTSIGDNATIYEQSQTPVPHVGPPPYQYSWAARERQIVGGIPTEEGWVFSKLLFPQEPIEHANLGRLGFAGRANQAVTAVGAFETVGLVWTKSEVAIVPGRGPEHNGTGEFDATIRVPSPGGCSDWRSVVDAPPGFFFQMTSNKLMLVPRTANATGSAGAVTWIGQPVRQTLAQFPIITGAVHVRSQMIVAFSCTNTIGDAGRILIYDLRREQWYVDTIGPAVAVSELDGRLAYIVAGVVSLQDLAAGVGAMPTALVQTGMQPVTKRLGWGHLYKVGLLGLDLGACSVECFIDYDDGVGFRSLGVEAFTGTGVAVQRFWSLAIQKTARFSIRFVMTGGSSTLGLCFNSWALEVEGSKNMVRVGSGGNVA